MIRALCFLLLFPLAAEAQFTYINDSTIPVRDDQGVTLSMPWAGGLNAAQYNTMDLDQDGTEDLVLFDRMAGKVVTFLRAGDHHVPAPQYQAFFPEELTNWMLLRDYDCDGRKDIFTGDVLGIKVYRNISTEGLPAWERYFFSTGFSGPKSQVLLTKGFSGRINLQLQFDDLPSITDMDGDGDLDILSMRFASGATVEFHQNFSMERYGVCDSLEFERITQTWGNFRECECGEFAFNGLDCAPATGGRTKHAGGKSLLALDINGDQQQDLLLSEAACARLLALQNTGTSTAPVINSFLDFPQPEPASFVLYPTAYHEDVDGDGKKDLVVTPNIFTKEFLNTNLRQSNWFYKNTGTSQAPGFTLVQKDFLQASMIDAGDHAVPAFTDYDGDGDLDLLVSVHSSENFASLVYLYENTGTPAQPEFVLVTRDYLGFSESRIYNVRIQFADVNGDRTADLVFTGTAFDTGTTSLYFLPNRSQSAHEFSPGTVERLDFPMTATEHIYLTDVNRDGRPDILAGRSEGNLEYWINNGTPSSPAFALADDTFLGFSTSSLYRQNLACAVADLDADGKADLVVGGQSGKAGIIGDYLRPGASVEDLQENIIFNELLNMYATQNLGGAIWPVVANIFNTNKPVIAVGNILGGIHVLKHDEGMSLPENPALDVFPNPVGRNDLVRVRADRPGMLQVITLTGQQVGEPVALKANQIHSLAVAPLAAGLYLLKFTANKKSTTRRLVVK